MILESGPNRVALAIVRAELSADGRAALAHLLRNAITPVVAEFPDDPGVDELRKLVEALVRKR